MQVTIKIEGLDQVRAQLGNLAKQADFAAARALNTTAYAANDRLKTDMAATFAGGATAYTLRAFSVKKATKTDLVAEVALRQDAPEGGISYHKALAHLFTGGERKYKKVEGFLRSKGLMPEGLTIAPGSAMRLDRFGNMDRKQLAELLTMLIARPSTMRVYRKTGRGKAPKAVDYFVVKPGAPSKLHPGIYRRIETSGSSALDPMIYYVNPVTYRKFIDLEKLGREVTAKTFQPAFDAELQKALSSAK